MVFYEPKWTENIGTAVRSAHCFGADFIGVIGPRYNKQASDTMATERHVPIVQYSDMADFLAHLPVGCEVVSLEMDGAIPLENFVHPQSVVYLVGGEDRTLPKVRNETRVKIKTTHCLNVAVAASIIMYDRNQKALMTPKPKRPK